MESTAMSRRAFVSGAAGAAGLAAAGMLAGTARADETDDSLLPESVKGAASDATAGDADDVAERINAVDYFSWVSEAPVIDDSEISQTVEADIVVMGGGNSGAMCAFAAAEEGATVAVLESQASDGIYYYGLHDIASVNSQWVLEHGIDEIKKSEFIAEWQRRNHNRSNPRLIKKFVDYSGEMVDWLLANGPAELADSLFLRTDNLYKQYFEDGNEINKFKCWLGTVQYNFNGAAPTLIEQAESRGATWYWETTGVVLVTEEAQANILVDQMDEAGNLIQVETPVTQTQVKGVIGRDADGNYIKFLAKKGVVLAGGDFSGNREMFAALMDEHRNLSWSHGQPIDNLPNGMFGRDGSGIKMGMWVGASMDPVPRIVCSPNITFRSDTYATNLLRWGAPFSDGSCVWGSPFMWVDGSGRRFTDETFLGVFGQVIRAQLSKPGRYFAIFDSNFRENISRMAPEHFSLPVDEDYDFEGLFASWVERGAQGGETLEGEGVCCWGAETLDELIEYINLDDAAKENLKAEIEKYNTYCANGEDEDFGRDPKTLVPVEQGPFYAIMSVDEKVMVGTVTLNGLVIDEDQRVLDKDYNPIPGLYATGNNSGGRFALEYSTQMQGLTLGVAMTLGRVLGQELARA